MSTKISSCCVTGHLHSGTPEGKDTQVAGVPAYVAGENSSKTLVFITDIFGYKLPNVRLLADEFAKTGGFKVVLPDVFDGDYVSVDHMKTLTPLKSDPSISEEEKGAKMQAAFGEVGPWLERHGDDKTKPLMDKVISELAAGGASIGVVGFCWGGRHAVILGGENSSVKAVVANHPSYTEIPAFEKVQVPTLVQCGTNDSLFPEDQQKQVKDSIFPSKKDAELIVYPDAVHGWTVRGDLNNKEEREQKEKASQTAIDFLKKYL